MTSLSTALASLTLNRLPSYVSHSSSSSFTSVLVSSATRLPFSSPTNFRREEQRPNTYAELPSTNFRTQFPNFADTIFNTFLHTEYGGPGTLLVIPFIDMADTINERGLPGGQQAARAAAKWAQDNVAKDRKEWNSGEGN